MNLKINDRIVHASFGVGKIKNIVSKEIGGKVRAFFKVKTDKLTYWIPVKKKDFNKIRPLRTASTFKNTLSVIRKKPQRLSNNFRARSKYIKDQINECSLLSKARLIRDLHYRNSEKPLHVNEHRIYEKLKNQFVNEFALAAEIQTEEAEEKLDDALMVSLQKAPEE